MRRLLITGANGFVGRHVLAAARGLPVTAATRSVPLAAAPDVRSVVVGALSGRTEWAEALAGVESVVHLAARVHVMQETSADPEAEFLAVNLAGSVRLAAAAASAGARRFVYVSSIKVNGEVTHEAPFAADSPARPVGAYAQSKWAAECELRELASRTGLELAIVRPVLVYGPGVGGNLRTILRWIARGRPLPLGAIHNRRHLLSAESLGELLVHCATATTVPDRPILAADPAPISTPALVRSLAAGVGVPPRLLAVPPFLLTLAGTLTGRHAMMSRLTSSLEVDTAEASRLSGWTGARATPDGLGAVGAWYRGAGMPEAFADAR